MIELKNNPAGNFFLLAGPCVIEGEEMAMRIAERVVNITEKLQIPYVFKGSYRKANRSRLDSFMGIGDEKSVESVTESTRYFWCAYCYRYTFCRRSRNGRRICRCTANTSIPLPPDRHSDSCCKTGKVVNIKKGQFLSPLAMRFAAEKVVEAGNKGSYDYRTWNNFRISRPCCRLPRHS